MAKICQAVYNNIKHPDGKGCFLTNQLQFPGGQARECTFVQASKRDSSQSHQDSNLFFQQNYVLVDDVNDSVGNNIKGCKVFKDCVKKE